MVEIPTEAAVIKSFLKDENFEEIYLVIKPHLKADINKDELHFDLANIVFNVPQFVRDKEHGPTHGEILKYLNRLYSDIARLAETLAHAEKLYPPLIDEECGNIFPPQIPQWLSPYIDHFERDKLQNLLKSLASLHGSALEYSSGGKKPRYSSRPYYIKELVAVFEKYTDLKAIVKRNDSTPFGLFAVAYFYYAPVGIKDKEGIGEYIVFEELNKLAKTNS